MRDREGQVSDRFFDVWRELRRGQPTRRIMPLFFETPSGPLTSSEADLLQVLLAAPAGLATGAAAERVGLDAGNASRVVERMAQRGLIRRSDGARGGRTRILSLTEEGERLAGLHRLQRARVFEAATPWMTPAEREAFVSTLERMVDSLGAPAPAV